MKFTKLMLLMLAFSFSQEALTSDSNPETTSRIDKLYKGINYATSFAIGAYTIVALNKPNYKLTNFDYFIMFISIPYIGFNGVNRSNPNANKEFCCGITGMCVGGIYSAIRSLKR